MKTLILSLLLIAQARPVPDADVRRVAMAGWRAARELAPKGGAIELLGPVNERLKELVCERVTDDPSIDASEIEVSVRGGEITLSGTVPDRNMKWRAEDLVESCARGAEVRNQLRTAPR